MSSIPPAEAAAPLSLRPRGVKHAAAATTNPAIHLVSNPAIAKPPANPIASSVGALGRRPMAIGGGGGEPTSRPRSSDAPIAISPRRVTPRGAEAASGGVDESPQRGTLPMMARDPDKTRLPSGIAALHHHSGSSSGPGPLEMLERSMDGFAAAPFFSATHLGSVHPPLGTADQSTDGFGAGSFLAGAGGGVTDRSMDGFGVSHFLSAHENSRSAGPFYPPERSMDGFGAGLFADAAAGGGRGGFTDSWSGCEPPRSSAVTSGEQADRASSAGCVPPSDHPCTPTSRAAVPSNSFSGTPTSRAAAPSNSFSGFSSRLAAKFSACTPSGAGSGSAQAGAMQSPAFKRFISAKRARCSL